MPIGTNIFIFQPVPRRVERLVACDTEIVPGDADRDQVFDSQEVTVNGTGGDGFPATIYLSVGRDKKARGFETNPKFGLNTSMPSWLSGARRDSNRSLRRSFR